MMVDELGSNDGDAVSAMVPIPGLANDWESCRGIRALIRDSGSIVQSEPGKYHATDTVAGVGANLMTLLPLMPRLWQPDEDGNGAIGMVSIPALEEQFLYFALCVFDMFFPLAHLQTHSQSWIPCLHYIIFHSFPAVFSPQEKAPTYSLDSKSTLSHANSARLKLLHGYLGTTPDPKKVKVDAWFIKKSCVLIKKKLTRHQWPRNINFVSLMNAVLGIMRSDGEDHHKNGFKKTPSSYMFCFYHSLFSIFFQSTCGSYIVCVCVSLSHGF